MKLEKGIYYIGDPGYIFGESWNEVLNQTDFFDSDDIQTLFGERCFAASSGGDGCLFDNQGRKYFVDSGTIGVMPISLIDIDKKVTIEEVFLSEGMHIVEFTEDFEVDHDYGGVTFGNIYISYNEDF